MCIKGVWTRVGRKGRFAVALGCLMLSLQIPLFAASSVTLAWDASPDANVTGYRIYYGAAPASYTNSITVGNITNTQIASLVEGMTYFFAATAFDASGLESDFSNETSYSVPATPVAPSIVSQPVNQTVVEGGNVSFGVTATGSGLLSYQWRRNGANLAGATSATLGLTGVTTNQAGNYSVVVNNSVGTATSSAAVLTVTPTPPTVALLSVNKSGSGTVTPDLGSTPLVVGQSYTLTATPAVGYVFAGWSGGIQSSSPTLTFTMTVGLVLQANFTASPYVAAAGTYNGLFNEADEVRLNSAGAFSVYADTSGNYSGWVQIGFARHTVSGHLELDSKATNVVTRWNTTSLTLELRVGQNSEAGQIFGRLTDGAWTAPLSGGRAAYQTAGSAPQAGDYTMVFPGQVGDPSLPAGDGYGTLHVGADGLGTLSGMLADGTGFSQSAWLTAEGDWPLYVSLYAGKGAVVSWMTFTNQASSDINGAVVWIKQANPAAVQYPAGFISDTKAVGSWYVASTGANKAVNLSSASVSFTGGNLPVDFSNTVSVNAGSSVVNLSPNALTLTISLTLGSFTGQVAEPGTGVVHPFSGVVLQKQNAGFGFLLGSSRSSRVTLAAP